MPVLDLGEPCSIILAALASAFGPIWFVHPASTEARQSQWNSIGCHFGDYAPDCLTGSKSSFLRCPVGTMFSEQGHYVQLILDSAMLEQQSKSTTTALFGIQSWDIAHHLPRCCAVRHCQCPASLHLCAHDVRLLLSLSEPMSGIARRKFPTTRSTARTKIDGSFWPVLPSLKLIGGT